MSKNIINSNIPLDDDRPFSRAEYDAIVVCETWWKNRLTNHIIVLQSNNEIEEKKKNFLQRYLDALYRGEASL
jgi:hypothetical protein